MSQPKTDTRGSVHRPQPPQFLEPVLDDDDSSRRGLDSAQGTVAGHLVGVASRHGTLPHLYLVGAAGSVAASNTIRPPTIVITGVMSLI